MSHALQDTKKFSLDHIRTQEYFLLAGPFVALIGNAASDIWLTLVAVMFLIHSAASKSWTWVRQPWFLISLVFWFWIMGVSIVSQWPANAMEQAGTWIRFPIFASAMVFWLTRSDKLWRQMLYSAMGGTVLLALILVFERAMNPEVLRLYGTWAQSPKPGWYMLGIGLPVVLWTLSRLKESSGNAKWAIPLLFLLFCATIATGEIYITMSLFFATGVFIVLSRFWHWSIIALGSLIVIGCIAVLMTNQSLFYRFTSEVMIRLPWLPTSDYYDAWVGGLNAGFLNPVFGIGVDNYEFYCENLENNGKLSLLGVQFCRIHPHNLYIQTFAETGIPGLLLLIALVFSLLSTVSRKLNILKLKPEAAAAIAIVFLVIWPISTYSQAFGQHKNMFTWFLIGWAMSTAIISLKRRKIL